MDSGVNRTFVTAPGYWKFESTFLQQGVCKLSVPSGHDPPASKLGEVSAYQPASEQRATAAEETALREWCAENGIELSET